MPHLLRIYIALHKGWSPFPPFTFCLENRWDAIYKFFLRTVNTVCITTWTAEFGIRDRHIASRQVLYINSMTVNGSGTRFSKQTAVPKSGWVHTINSKPSCSKVATFWFACKGLNIYQFCIHSPSGSLLSGKGAENREKQRQRLGSFIMSHMPVSLNPIYLFMDLKGSLQTT